MSHFYIMKKTDLKHGPLLEVQEKATDLDDAVQKLRAFPGCCIYEDWEDVTPSPKPSTAALAAKALKNLRA